MQQEQQQRILGYFLEEAREHLNTIEQGLLNLQTTLEDSEMINEVFRAAHSIKGGAAMLGLSSIQHTSHRLEDCFKILKENPIQVDQKLESLLLDVCDTLKALIENLGNPFGLSEEKAQALMSKTEPVLKWLNDHIETLLKQGNSGVKNLNNLPTTHLQVETSVPPQKPPIVTKQHQDWKNFQAQVLEILREMLQQFKQTNLEISRKNLQKCCHQLSKIGRDLNLSNWCSLCESAALAISNPNNSYLTLAKIIITEIKQAQELVLKNKDAEIAISQQLETLCPRPQQSLLAFENTEIQEPLLTGTTELNVKPPASVNATNLTELIDKSRSLFNHRQSTLIHNHSEIGVSELNNLADLFADDTQELNDNWQQGEILGNVTNYQLGITKGNDSEELNINDDLDSLLFFEDDDEYQINASNNDDLNILFDDNFLEPEAIYLADLETEISSLESRENNNLWSSNTDLEFPSDDVITELILISRESQQPHLKNREISTNKLEELYPNTGDDSELPPEAVQLSVTAKTTKPENITISKIGIEPEISVDNSLFSAKKQGQKYTSSPEKIIPKTVEVSKTQPSVPESSSLDNLFEEVGKNRSSLTQEIDDLFDTPEIKTNVSNSIDDLDNFWDDISTTESESTTLVNQDGTKELEESLSSAFFEVVTTNQQLPVSNSSNKKEFNPVFQEQEQSFDLFFTSDKEDNLFDDVVDANSNTVPGIVFNKLSVTKFSDSSSTLRTPQETRANTPLVKAVEDSNDDNLIFFEEDITDFSNSVSEELINELVIYSEKETALLEAEANSDFTNSNLELQSNPTTNLVFAGGKTSTELDSKTTVEEFLEDEFAVLAAILDEPVSETTVEEFSVDEFAELEAILSPVATEITHDDATQDEDFAELEALLGGNEDNKPEVTLQISRPAVSHSSTSEQKLNTPTPIPPLVKSQNTFSAQRPAQDIQKLEEEFSELENLLEQSDKISNISTISGKTSTSKIPRPTTRRTPREESMKIPVKQLDDMSNLVGELVVNRNTLEQDHERLRQSLDSLLVQVQHLSDVGVRMEEYYERSLLEASLLASRRSREHDNSSNADNRGFSEIEMDRFTPFHILAQEMIEFIVRIRESASDIDFITEETEQVSRQLRQATNQLQEGLTKARMVPFSQAIDRLRRGVRDNAIKYGKQVELTTEGVETLVDKMILDQLTDPLTHMVNNAIAHGIETPEVRQAAGKSPVGTINIRALQQGNQTIISVSDDGGGIDHQRVKNKAVKKGILTPEQAKTMSRTEAYQILFLPSFSTADEVDDIKGRGVGMNVVYNDISEIRGTVSTDSTIGKGTTFTIRLPLTLSICKALFCISDQTRIAFPMDGVEDTLNIPTKDIQRDADGQSFIVWRDTVLPFQPLKEILVFNRHLTRGKVYGTHQDDDMMSVIVVRSGSTMIALQVDQVLSEQEIAIKQFEGPAPKPSGVAGATVLGDGMIMPIADVIEIIDIFQGKMSKNMGGNWQHTGLPDQPIPTNKVEPVVLIIDDSITVRELLSLTFTKVGYRVEQARDGQEAWDKLRSGLPCDIIFCDIEMPRCDGLEFLSRIQKDGSFANLPIAMLTSRGADKHRQMALQLGASGYFTKPYLEEAILEAAARMLKGENLAATV